MPVGSGGGVHSVGVMGGGGREKKLTFWLQAKLIIIIVRLSRDLVYPGVTATTECHC